ncbi:MAG: hypothetical protein HUU22_17390 [Phycisphaerae bacterium]|nr:hypothetical protein [Phycisphaerae bacterium]NUQ47797.1 hypothetical protein [Phycisphaerae bacterium]
MLVPEAALAALATQGTPFTIHGPARYEQNVPSFKILLLLRFSGGDPVPEG